MAVTNPSWLIIWVVWGGGGVITGEKTSYDNSERMLNKSSIKFTFWVNTDEKRDPR